MNHEEEILKIEREQLKFQKDNLSLFQDLVKGQSHIKVNTDEIIHKIGKQLLITFLAIFLAGVVVGTSYKGWLPYISEITSAYNTVKGAAK